MVQHFTNTKIFKQILNCFTNTKNIDNMYIVIICFPVYKVINFEINLSFLIKLFFCLTKQSDQKFKYLNNNTSF